MATARSMTDFEHAADPTPKDEVAAIPTACTPEKPTPKRPTTQPTRSSSA